MTCFQSSPLRLLFAVAIVGILPPALTRAEDEKPVKVFILAGQSNMQGHSPIAMGKDGDLDYAARQEQFAYLQKDGQWVERDDVWYYHKNGQGEVTTSNLKPGLGAKGGVGPELAFGHVVGEYYDEQVLLIKCAWGGQAIGMTFRPPSSGLPDDATLQMMYEGAKKKQPDLTMDEYQQRFGVRYRQVQDYHRQGARS